MGWQRKAKEFFYLVTITLLCLLLPLSFLLLASLSRAQFYLQALKFFYQKPFPFIFSLAFDITPCILYLLVSIVAVATLIQGLTGKITLLNDYSSNSILQPRLCIAWILLCTFQVCVGLGIEGNIWAGLYDSDELGLGGERSFLSKMIFLLGLHETTQIWARIVVRPVVDDSVFGVARKEKWIEKVILAGSLGTLWWWRLRKEIDNLVGMGMKEEMMDVKIGDFVGWWLYYLTVTIGMVRTVKGIMWMFMISLCRRRIISTVESNQNDDKV